MNEIIKNIYERRAVRKYKDVPVAKEIIDQLIAAGRMAPSAMDRQPLKFYIVTDKEKISMCAQNIMLAARAMGLETCPVGFGRFVMQTKDYFRLNIPATEQVELAVIIGYRNDEPKAHPRIEDNAFYV